MQLSAFFAKHIKSLSLILVGLFFSLAGVVLIIIHSFLSASNDIQIIDNSNTATTSSTIENSKLQIFVEVTGAVNNPNVYSFFVGDRVNDAINKAGGLAPNANLDYVTKSINKAAKLVDGQKIYIPSNDEKATPVLGTSTESKILNINNATENELEGLAGVGPVTAGKIISNRPYSDLNELVTKKALTSKVFEAIKNKISLY